MGLAKIIFAIESADLNRRLGNNDIMAIGMPDKGFSERDLIYRLVEYGNVGLRAARRGAKKKASYPTLELKTAH